LLQIKGLQSRGSEDYSLHDVTLDIGAGEVLALVGVNEYEINSFIEAAYGLSEITSGEFSYRGSVFAPRDLRDQPISFLFRKTHLFEHLTVAENIFLPALPRGRYVKTIRPRKIIKDAREILRNLNFPIEASDTVSVLTVEQRKLVSIARAFNNRPELIIMNSPMEALGASSAQNLYEIIRRFKGAQGSVIYLTQFWEEALRIADRISVLVDGCTSKVFFTEDVRKNPQQLLGCLGHYNYRGNVADRGPVDKAILDSILKTAESITGEYELKDVLTMLSEQVVRFMGADGCTIHVIDEETGTVIEREEMKADSRLFATLKDDVVLKIAQSERLFYANMHEKDFTSNFSKIVGVKTVLCVPLLVRAHVIGVMQIFYEQYYAHSEEQAKYLSTFAKHAEIAIEDTKLLGRSALLQESHHRIKNNLQSVMNLISLQKRTIGDGRDDEWNAALDDIISRVKSIALVHDLLSRDKKGRSVVDIREIIQSIARYSLLLSEDVKAELNLENILIPYNKATSIALIVNELISNCLKHAFGDGKDKLITISCIRNDGKIVLEVSNNGSGLSPGFSIEDSSGLGLSIVNSIIKHEFKGSIGFREQDGLTVVTITLPVVWSLLE